MKVTEEWRDSPEFPSLDHMHYKGVGG